MKFETTASGARVFNGASGGGILEVYSGDAGSTAGPELKLIRNSDHQPTQIILDRLSLLEKVIQV